MSRFDEIREAYAAARKSFFTQREASAAFAATVIQGMASYIQCPAFSLHFVPYTQDASSSKTHSAQGAIWLGNDALWHFKMALDLRADEEGVRKETAGQTVTFELLVQPDGPGFSVGVKGFADRFSLPAAPGSAQHTAFYDFVCKQILTSYLQPGQRFFDNMADSQHAVGG